MRVLAIHTLGHDTGLAVFEGDTLVYAIETERVTRVRHDHRIAAALAALWSDTGLDPTDIDYIAFSTGLDNSIAQIEGFPSQSAGIGPNQLSAEGWSHMLGRRLPCSIVAHEAAHAAIACHSAMWETPTLVLVNEGRGSFSRSSCFLYDGTTLSLLEYDSLPWYATGFGWGFVAYLMGIGTSPSAAGTAMALGGYGQFNDGLAEIFVSIDPAISSRPLGEQLTLSKTLAAYLASNASFSQRAGVISTLQALFTERVRDLCLNRLKRTGASRLALAGGCALNLHSNTVLRDAIAGGAISIPPNCNDAGQAIGAGLYAIRFHLGGQPRPYSVYSNGSRLSSADSANALEEAGLRGVPYDIVEAASALARGNIMSFAQGSAELGPRALGNRSLLASPTTPGMKERLSQRLKQREWFRPLACVMRRERFERLLPQMLPSPHMLFQYDVPYACIPEATHVDGTCRIQTVEKTEHAALWHLLEEFERVSDTPGLINTSLNGPKRPIAQYARHVLDDFATSDVDIFVFDDIMSKRP